MAADVVRFWSLLGERRHPSLEIVRFVLQGFQTKVILLRAGGSGEAREG